MQTTLVIFTMGGNDVAAISQQGADASADEVMMGYPATWALAESVIEHLESAVAFLTDPINFPNGSYLIFANPFEFTDATGDIESCTPQTKLDIPGIGEVDLSQFDISLAALAGFGQWENPDAQEAIVIWLLEEYMRVAGRSPGGHRVVARALLRPRLHRHGAGRGHRQSLLPRTGRRAVVRCDLHTPQRRRSRGYLRDVQGHRAGVDSALQCRAGRRTMTRYALWLVAFPALLLASEAAARVEITSLEVASAIEKGRPVGVSDRFSVASTKKVYAYIIAKNTGAETQLAVVWERNGKPGVQMEAPRRSRPGLAHVGAGPALQQAHRELDGTHPRW